MKKSILLLALCGVFSTLAEAQITTKAGTFTKPKKKDLLLEINFGPDLNESPGIYSLPILAQGSDIVVLKGRKFIADNKELRGLVNFSYNDDGEVSDYSVALGVGLERHRGGKERLSTYWGYGAAVGQKSNSELMTNWMTGEEKTLTESTLALSLSVFSGFDYYIMPDIYLGLELNYGFGWNSFSPFDGDDVSSFAVSPGVSPFLRMGWRL